MLGTMSIIVRLGMFCQNVVTMVALWSKKIVDTASVSFMVSLCLFAVVCALCWVLIERGKIKTRLVVFAESVVMWSRTLRIHKLSHPVDLWLVVTCVWVLSRRNFLNKSGVCVILIFGQIICKLLFFMPEETRHLDTREFCSLTLISLNVQHFWTTSDSMI